MYIRPKLVGLFPRPYARGSYVHRIAFFYSRKVLQNNVSTGHYSSSYLGNCQTYSQHKYESPSEAKGHHCQLRGRPVAYKKTKTK
jgi:hypothetical protein